MSVDLPQQRLGVQDADNIVGIVSPQRYPGIGAVHDMFDDLTWRQVGIHHSQVLAMVHDLSDIDIGQIEDAAQHDAFLAHFGGIALMQLDGAAQRFLCFGQLSHTAILDTDHPHRRGNDDIDRMRNRRQDGNRQPVGVLKGICLGKDFAENQDENRHCTRRIDDAGFAEKPDQQAGGQCRCQNVDEVVAQQDGADHFFLFGKQAGDDLGAPVALFFQQVHSWLRGRSEGCFRTGKQSGENQQHGNAADCHQRFGIHQSIVPLRIVFIVIVLPPIRRRSHARATPPRRRGRHRVR